MTTQHTVAQGEDLSSIAQQHGFRNPALIYEHAGNAGLRRQRPDPDLLFPGDRVTIPEKARKTMTVPVDRRHTFSVPRRQRVLRLRLLDGDGAPMTSQPVQLSVDGGEARTLRTDGDGIVELPVPIGARRGELSLAGRTRRLDLAHLNPVAETADDGLSGLQARLCNLGYLAVVTGELDRATRIAISLFQRDMELAIDAEPNAQTLDRLIAEHGC